MKKTDSEWLRSLSEQLQEEQQSTTDDITISNELCHIIWWKLTEIADRIDYLERRCL